MTVLLSVPWCLGLQIQTIKVKKQNSFSIEGVVHIPRQLAAKAGSTIFLIISISLTSNKATAKHVVYPRNTLRDGSQAVKIIEAVSKRMP